MTDLLKKVFLWWFDIPQSLRFIFVGGYNSVLVYLIFILLYSLLKGILNYAVILLITYMIGIFNSFLVFKIFVFQTKGNWLKEFLSTFAHYTFIYPINLLILYISSEYFHFSQYLGQVIAIMLIPTITYFILKDFAFKKR